MWETRALRGWLYSLGRVSEAVLCGCWGGGAGVCASACVLAEHKGHVDVSIFSLLLTLGRLAALSLRLCDSLDMMACELELWSK